jgi:hypothetical protein
MNIKCYGVTGNEDYGTALVWAKSSGRAKSIAMGQLWGCEMCEYTELQCRRYPQFDGLREEGYCSGNNPSQEDLRLMYLDGWHEIEGSCDTCEDCGLSVWESIPESHLNDDGICQHCAGLRAAMEASDE